MSSVKTRLIPYMGSKWTLAPTIIDLLGSHDTYVEVFGGSASVLLRKPQAKVEVYNDINHNLVTFFTCVREHPEELRAAIEATPYARVEFERCIDALDGQQLRPVETARCVAVVLMQSIQANLDVADGNWSSGPQLSPGGTRRGRGCDLWKWYDLASQITTASQRLRSVFIECKPWPYILNRYDSPRTAFYVDPPYMHGTRGSSRYSDEMNEDDHSQLLVSIQAVEGHVVLSGYRCDIYDQALEGWQRVDREQKTQGTNRTECLWVKPGKQGAQRSLFTETP